MIYVGEQRRDSERGRREEEEEGGQELRTLLGPRRGDQRGSLPFWFPAIHFGSDRLLPRLYKIISYTPAFNQLSTMDSTASSVSPSDSAEATKQRAIRPIRAMLARGAA